MLFGMGGIVAFIYYHNIPVKEFLVKDASSFLGRLPANLYSTVFIFLPWLGVCYVVSGQFGKHMVDVLRSESESLGPSSKYYKPKPLSTSEQRPLLKIYHLLVNFGLTFVPLAGVMVQNMVIPRIPIPVIAQLAGVISNLVYFSFNVFSVHWLRISINPSNSSFFPSSFDLLDRFRFVEQNWPYFIGFVFPTVITSHFIIPVFVVPFVATKIKLFISPLFFTTIQVFSMITAWPVVEKYELATLKKSDGESASSDKVVPDEPVHGYFHAVGPDQPVFSKNGFLPLPAPIFSYIPTKFTEFMNWIFAEKEKENEDNNLVKQGGGENNADT